MLHLYTCRRPETTPGNGPLVRVAGVLRVGGVDAAVGVARDVAMVPIVRGGKLGLGVALVNRVRAGSNLTLCRVGCCCFETVTVLTLSRVQ